MNMLQDKITLLLTSQIDFGYQNIANPIWFGLKQTRSKANDRGPHEASCFICYVHCNRY